MSYIINSVSVIYEYEKISLLVIPSNTFLDSVTNLSARLYASLFISSIIFFNSLDTEVGFPGFSSSSFFVITVFVTYI